MKPPARSSLVRRGPGRIGGYSAWVVVRAVQVRLVRPRGRQPRRDRGAADGEADASRRRAAQPGGRSGAARRATAARPPGRSAPTGTAAPPKEVWRAPSAAGTRRWRGRGQGLRPGPAGRQGARGLPRRRDGKPSGSTPTAADYGERPELRDRPAGDADGRRQLGVRGRRRREVRLRWRLPAGDVAAGCSGSTTCWPSSGPRCRSGASRVRRWSTATRHRQPGGGTGRWSRSTRPPARCSGRPGRTRRVQLAGRRDGRRRAAGVRRSRATSLARRPARRRQGPLASRLADAAQREHRHAAGRRRLRVHLVGVQDGLLPAAARRAGDEVTAEKVYCRKATGSRTTTRRASTRTAPVRHRRRAGPEVRRPSEGRGERGLGRPRSEQRRDKGS